MPLPSTVRKPVTVPVESALRESTISLEIRSLTRVIRTFEPMLMVAAWDMAGATGKLRNLNSAQRSSFSWLPSGSFPVSTWPMAGW
jgi:hypothetical protein